MCDPCVTHNWQKQESAASLISALQVPDCLLCGSVPDGGHVGPDLLVESCEPLPLLPADARLLLLVDDLVETLVEENGEALAAVLRGRHISGVVVGHLADVIGDIGHMGMILHLWLSAWLRSGIEVRKDEGT